MSEKAVGRDGSKTAIAIITVYSIIITIDIAIIAVYNE